MNYDFRAMVNVKKFYGQTNGQTDGQIDKPKTTCPLSIDTGA